MRTPRILILGTFALLLATTVMPANAEAISADVAKKCSALRTKQFPPREPGNPAAGSAKGTAQAARDFYKKCVDNGGNMDGAADKNAK